MIIKPNKNLSSLELLKFLKDATTEDKIKVTGLGIFRLKRIASKVVRNPKTHEMMQAPARLKLSFKASKTMLDQLKDNLKS